jgi:hypothetical protein
MHLNIGMIVGVGNVGGRLIAMRAPQTGDADDVSKSLVTHRSSIYYAIGS